MSCTNCTNVFDFGCIPHCEGLFIGQNATETGTWTLHTNFNGTSVIQEFEVVDGEEIELPMSGLNESYEFSIQIKDSEGTVFTFTIEDIEYNCVKITLLP